MKSFIPKSDLIEKDEQMLQLSLLLEGTDGAAKMCPLHISTQAEYIHRCSKPTRPTTTVDREIVRQGTKNKRNDSTFPLLQLTPHSIFQKHCASE